MRLVNGDISPDGPGPQEVELEHPVNVVRRGEERRTQAGGFVRIPDPGGALHPTDSFLLRVFVWPTTPGRARQGLVSRWDDATATGWLLTLDAKGLSISLGGGRGGVATVPHGSAAAVPDVVLRHRFVRCR